MKNEQLDYFIIKNKTNINQEVGQGSAEFCMLLMLLLFLIVAIMVITNPQGATKLDLPNFF